MMDTIVVTGAAGSVGARVCRALAQREDVRAVIALDLHDDVPSHQRIIAGVVDLRTDDLKPLFEDASTVVHLASSFSPGVDGIDTASSDLDATQRVLDAAAAVGVERVVLLSSAMVYGAWPANPVPITEEAPTRPNPEFSFAVTKAEIERLAMRWADDHPGTAVVLLRPTTALAEGDISWVARSLRASAIIDAGDSDPPQQFVHLDDLAAAAVLAARSDMVGAYNVAPDGWVDSETRRDLSGRTPRVHLPEHVADRFGRFRWRHRLAPTPPGLTPYTVHPWIVANDRLRAAGWEPTSTNEEAYVEGTPPKPWATLNAKRRQQLALGGAGVLGALATLGLALLVRRLRNRGQ